MTKLLLSLLLLTTAAFPQDITSALRPPKGSPIALVVFEDLQCPECRRAAPVVAQAGQTYKIPVVRHDFPLPMHNWSWNAAILARYFDTHSKAVGNAFRDYVFEHQLEILPNNLRGFAEKFAADHKISLPFVLDPDGKLAAEVNADKELGKTLNLDHTPTIYIVSDKKTPNPYVEVKDKSQLFAMIDSMKK
jgi:protein-disulfide isomerase